MLEDQPIREKSVREGKLPKYSVLYKKRGQTPLELLATFKASQPRLREVPLSYAGRLDPMAEGKLLVLIGDECKKQKHYTDLDKEYEVTVLLGAKTDTGDLLGLAEPVAKNSGKTSTDKTFLLQNVQKAIRRERGSHSRRYPVFSSKTVHGKPLFLYALEGRVQEIQIPEHIETIYSISLMRNEDKHTDIEELSLNQLRTRIPEALAVVPRSDTPSKTLGENFRQDAVRARWEEFFRECERYIPDAQDPTFFLLRLRITCGSGAYMRTLAERIGHSLGVSALAFTITRTKMGRFFRIGPCGFWIKLY